MAKVGTFMLGTVTGVVALGALAFLIDKFFNDPRTNTNATNADDLAAEPEDHSGKTPEDNVNAQI